MSNLSKVVQEVRGTPDFQPGPELNYYNYEGVVTYELNKFKMDPDLHWHDLDYSLH